MNNTLPSKKICVQLMAKAPVAGLAKTRLIPVLGEVGAAALAKKMLDKILSDCSILIKNCEWHFECTLWMTPAPESPSWQSIKIPNGIQQSSQYGDDLGERMAHAVEQGLSADSCAVIIIGSDCPEINPSVLIWAATILQDHDACMVPCADGGYALLGLRNYEPRLFVDIPWSSEHVADLTRRRLIECGMSYVEAALVHDIDVAADLAYLPSAWPESRLAMPIRTEK